jgi:glycosyltransferase involved in cell wall biosynthesis
MQIEIVDDCSPGADVAGLVQSISHGRVQFSRTSRNLGLAGCWNTCLDRARGNWVHILHQDDLLYPGFYAELERLIAANPAAGSAFTRHAFADANSHWHWISALERSTPGILEDWATAIAADQRLQCVAVVARRECYERLGGFRTDLPYVLDWEMWARLAQNVPVAYSPRILAAYRQHDESASARLHREGRTLPDMLRGFEHIVAGLPEARRAEVRERFLNRYFERVWNLAYSDFRERSPDRALALLRENWSLVPTGRRTDFRFLYLRCLLQRLKRGLGR